MARARSPRRPASSAHPRRRLARSSRCRPGTYSSSTTWKFVPPKPNALTPARRTPSGGAGQSRSSVFDPERGAWPSRRSGSGRRSAGSAASTLSCRLMHRLEQPGGAGGGLEVADVGLDRAERDRPGRAPARPKTSVRLSSSVASPTRVEVPCASTADAVAGSTPAVAPRALDREPLADRVRRGDALALAVARAADAEQHGVDAVAVALGVGEPLEDEQRPRPRPSRSRRRPRRTAACRSPTARRSCRTSRRRRRPCCGRRRR